ncbi:hypothetical protein PFISCL1PPCAC_23225, partial [Pristionchus fissidentatus]
TPVYFLSSDFALTIDSSAQFATVISDTTQFIVRDITGNFSEALPVVYATGFDVPKDSICHPVFSARSEMNAKATTIIINGPIATIDFGSVGEHSVTVTNREELLPAMNFDSSAVYSSPG